MAEAEDIDDEEDLREIGIEIRSDSRPGKNKQGKSAKDTDGMSAIKNSGQSSEDQQYTKLKDKITIMCHERLPELDAGPVEAYAAHTPEVPNLFAYVCKNYLAPRFHEMETYRIMKSTSLLHLFSNGVVYWPPLKKYVYVIVYENHMGQPLIEKSPELAFNMKAEDVTNLVIKPLANGLMELKNADLTHGNISVENMYYIETGGIIERIVLGDCLAVPPSYNQPSLYSPIERAVAQPSGRGIGNFPNDMYAFGICIAIFLRSADPMKDMTQDEIIKSKMEMGSYIAMTNKDRFSGGVLELLRGLLHDDPSQRLKIEQIFQWLEGTRISPKQATKRHKAARPIFLDHKKYYRPEILAFDFTKYSSHALEIINDNSLVQWISRSVEDKKCEARVVTAINSAAEFGKNTSYQERLLCRVSTAMEPRLPVQYKGAKVLPYGIGSALAEAIAKNENLNVYAEILLYKELPFWLSIREDPYFETASLHSNFEKCRNFVNNPNIGFGIERCLYTLNKNVPCLSEKFSDYYIKNSEDLLFAMDHMIGAGKDPGEIMDRHVVAFLAVRENRSVSDYFLEMNTDLYHKKVVATLNILAIIQRITKTAGVYNLSQWMVNYIKPFVERYHDRDLRKKQMDKLQVAGKKGDLVRLATIVNDRDVFNNDFKDYKKALKKYYELKKEHYTLKNDLRDKDTYGKGTGREIASMCSGILAALLILVITFMFFSNGSAINSILN